MYFGKADLNFKWNTQMNARYLNIEAGNRSWSQEVLSELG